MTITLQQQQQPQPQSPPPCIITLHGMILDVSHWQAQHPGGVLQNYHGRDATQAFEAARHSDAARSLLLGLRVEDETEDDNDPFAQPTRKTSHTTTPHSSSSSRRPTTLVLLVSLLAWWKRRSSGSMGTAEVVVDMSTTTPSVPHNNANNNHNLAKTPTTTTTTAWHHHHHPVDIPSSTADTTAFPNEPNDPTVWWRPTDEPQEQWRHSFA